MKKAQSILPLHKLPKVIQRNLELFFIGAVVVLLLVGTFVAVKLSEREQELRQQASVTGGIVDVTFTPAQSPLNADAANTVNVAIDTHSLQLLGVQLKFQVLGNFSTAPTVDLLSGTGFSYVSLGTSIATPVITPISGGYEISMAVISSSGLGQPVSTSNPTNVFQLHLTPTGAQTISVNFDNQFSNALDTTPQSADQLNTLQNFTLPVTVAGVPTDTPIAQATNTLTPSPTQCAQPTQPLCQVNQHVDCVNQVGTAVCAQCQCVNDSATPTPTNTPSIACDPLVCATGQTAVLVDANSQPCATYACVDNTPIPTQIVELPTNTPIPTATPDVSGTGGITIKYCGESCTAHSDCAVNLMCYSGVCRLANNPTDTSCNNPPDNGIHRTCNEYCADSRECQSGLTCYYNKCRNPRNVNDQYCAEPIVYNTRVVNRTVIVTATPEPIIPTEAPRGGDNTQFGGTVPTDAQFLPTETPWPTYAPIAQTTPEPTSDQFTMVQRIQSWLKGLLIVALAISAVFFLLWILPLFLKRRNDDDDDQPPMPMSGTGKSSDQIG